MIAKRDYDGFSVITLHDALDDESRREAERPAEKKRRRSVLSETYFARKRTLTMREVARLDDEVVVVANFPYGIVVLRSNPNPQHLKIRKLLDRIGIVGIGSDSAIDIMHDLLEMRIDSILRPGYTRGDVWGNELGKFLSRVLGEFFFARGHDEGDLAIFPAYAFLFEVGHPLYGNFVELITFDGQAESRLPSITIFSPGKGDESLAKKIGETLTHTIESIPDNQKVEPTAILTAFVGNAAKVIREFRGSPVFECVYLDALAAAGRDFRRVWTYIDVEAAIASVGTSPQP